jgi:hypothetical protein
MAGSSRAVDLAAVLSTDLCVQRNVGRHMRMLVISEIFQNDQLDEFERGWGSVLEV